MKISSKLMIQLERYVRLETVDKLSVLVTFVIVAGVVFALGTSAIFFLSTALAEGVSLIVGNSALAYLIVGLFLVLLIWIFLSNKKAWVENKVVRSMSEAILSEPMVTGEDTDYDPDMDLMNEDEKGDATV